MHMHLVVAHPHLGFCRSFLALVSMHCNINYFFLGTEYFI